MKKAIAALLSLFVGIWGYAIVDKDYVSNTEKEIESLKAISSEYESYRNKDSSNSTDSTTDSTTDPNTHTNDYYGTRTFLTSENYDEVSSCTEWTVWNGVNEYKKFIVHAEAREEGGYYCHQVTTNETVTEDDYAVYIRYDEPTCIAKEDVTRVFYDNDLNPTSDYDYTRMVVVYHVTGYTDALFAGEKICFGYYYKNPGVINSDGTFDFYYYRMIHSNDNPFYIYNGETYELNNVRIF